MVRAEDHSLAFGSYRYHLYLYSALVPGERNSNSTPAQSATVSGNLRALQLDTLNLNVGIKQLYKTYLILKINKSNNKYSKKDNHKILKQLTTMKKIVICLLLITLTINMFGQDTSESKKINSYPTNFNETNFNKIDEFDGKTISYDGVILQIEKSRNNTPFYKIRIGQKNYLWTVLMFENDRNKIGDTIRVIGFLTKSEANELEKKFLDRNQMVIAFGLLDLRNSNLLFIGGAKKQKQEWIDGKIPDSN